MDTSNLLRLIEELKELNIENYGSDFLLTWDKTLDEIKATSTVAMCFRGLHRLGISYRLFESGLAVSIFRDNSTRTRFSFASAADALGLQVSDLDEKKSQIAHGETVRETANMISFLTEAVGIRDDMFLGEGNTYMREVASALDEGFNRGVLHGRPALVNLQCDMDHPTQTLSDLLKLKSYFGSFEALKGKKIAMTWAYSPSYGKPLSVPQGIIALMTRFGMNVALAHPKGYDLIPETQEISKKYATESGGGFSKVDSMEEAFEGADVVYPKSWAPYSVMQERTKLLKAGDSKGLDSLEEECLTNNAKYKSWECNREKMNLTAGKKALYMHCLPADVSNVSCKTGEVSKEIFEQYRLETYEEAGFKPFVISAMIFLAKVKDPGGAITALLKEARPRRRF